MAPALSEAVRHGDGPHPQVDRPEHVTDIPRLLMQFESLGENCDFGVVQRAAGIEPLGLFRFASCTGADVATLLRARLEPLCTPEDLWLDEVGPLREYCIRSKRYSYGAHTGSYAGQADAEMVRLLTARKLGFLKAQLLRDLAGARKIFVFKGDPSAATLHDIAQQLRQFGPNRLLWISVGDAARPPGTVRRIDDGVMQGFVTRFGTYDGDPSLPVPDWIAVCAEAYRIWHAAAPPTARLDNLIAALPASLAGGTTALQHRLPASGSATVHQVHLPIATGGDFVFSAWIRIPAAFRGRRIGASLPGFDTRAEWLADMKCRDRWQRIWLSARLPADATGIACALVADGEADAAFQSAYWCLERGTYSLGRGFIPPLSHAA